MWSGRILRRGVLRRAAMTPIVAAAELTINRDTRPRGTSSAQARSVRPAHPRQRACARCAVRLRAAALVNRYSANGQHLPSCRLARPEFREGVKSSHQSSSLRTAISVCRVVAKPARQGTTVCQQLSRSAVVLPAVMAYRDDRTAVGRLSRGGWEAFEDDFKTEVVRPGHLSVPSRSPVGASMRACRSLKMVIP